MNLKKPECDLCQIVEPNRRRKEPLWIADLKVSTAFLSENQICPGYTYLVYNKGHATELFQLATQERQNIMEDITKIAKAIFDAFHPKKMNYELLGNIDPHLHWHIIPRKTSDPIPLQWPIWGKDYVTVKLSKREYINAIRKIRKKM